MQWCNQLGPDPHTQDGARAAILRPPLGSCKALRPPDKHHLADAKGTSPCQNGVTAPDAHAIHRLACPPPSRSGMVRADTSYAVPDNRCRISAACASSTAVLRTMLHQRHTRKQHISPTKQRRISATGANSTRAGRPLLLRTKSPLPCPTPLAQAHSQAKRGGNEVRAGEQNHSPQTMAMR